MAFPRSPRARQARAHLVAPTRSTRRHRAHRRRARSLADLRPVDAERPFVARSRQPIAAAPFFRRFRCRSRWPSSCPANASAASCIFAKSRAASRSVSIHLDALGASNRLWIFWTPWMRERSGEVDRARSCPSGPLVLGADLNTWHGSTNAPCASLKTCPECDAGRRAIRHGSRVCACSTTCSFAPARIGAPTTANSIAELWVRSPAADRLDRDEPCLAQPSARVLIARDRRRRRAARNAGEWSSRRRCISSWIST